MRQWRDIAGFEGRYEVSDDGLVYSAVTLSMLKQQTHHSRYKTVALTRRDGSGQKTGFLIHRLVAQAFIPNPKALATVNHKNGMRDDNRLENLEWMSHAENHTHAYRELGRKPHLATLRDSSRACACFKDGHIAGVFDQATLGAAHFGLRTRSVSRAALGERKTCGGLTWMYLD